MIKRGLISLAALALLSAPAFAFQCPADMSKIDEALAAGTTLSEEDLAKVSELRAEGEKLHNEGDHAKSVEVLGEAIQMLGIE